MKKQKTLLIIVLIVAVLMVGLYLAMGLMSGKVKKTTNETSKVPMLTNMEDITYVQYKNVEGTVTLVKTDDAWANEENAELELVSGYVDEKVAELGKIEGTLVADAVKADCGLEEAIYTLTVKNAKETVTLVIGVSDDGVFYAQVDGESKIYEIDEEVVQILNMNADDFAQPDDDMYTYYIDTAEQETDEETEYETDDSTGTEIDTEGTTTDDATTEGTTTDDATTDDTVSDQSTTEE